MSNDSEIKLEKIIFIRSDLNHQDLRKKIIYLSQTTVKSWDDWVDICYRQALGDRPMPWENK